MLEVDENLVITISQGDLLDITYNVSGIVLNSDSEIYMSIKENWLSEKPLLLKQCSGVYGAANKIRVIIPSSEMACLKGGIYYYDLVYKVGKNKRTLIYPTRFIVREVLHDG